MTSFNVSRKNPLVCFFAGMISHSIDTYLYKVKSEKDKSKYYTIPIISKVNLEKSMLAGAIGDGFFVEYPLGHSVCKRPY